MLRIGDFSKISRISIRMLRHYDEMGLLVPAMVDEFTGYRYYSEAQIPQAERIQALKNMGFGLAAIGEILAKYEDAYAMEQFLLVRRKELEEQAQLTQQRLKLLENTIQWLRKDGSIMDYIVTLKTLPERYVASVRQVIAAYENEGDLWRILNKETAQQNLQMANPCYGLAVYHDEGYKERDVDVEIQISVQGIYTDTEHVRFKTIEPVLIASAAYKGSYDQITRVSTAVAKWISENGLDIAGKSFCIYHSSPHDTSDPDELVTEVCFPVKNRQPD